MEAAERAFGVSSPVRQDQNDAPANSTPGNSGISGDQQFIEGGFGRARGGSDDPEEVQSTAQAHWHTAHLQGYRKGVSFAPS